MASESQALSPKAKENLQRNAELRQKDNKFVKLQPSEKKVYQFDPEKIEQVEAEFNGKKSQRYRYTITDPSDSSNQEKYLEVGKRTSEDIDAYLSEGKTLLKIQRFGLGKDTRYHVTSA
ncbi:MAG TPA: hypothetical protein VFZ67_04060 [Nitrososphaera sp.]